MEKRNKLIHIYFLDSLSLSKIVTGGEVPSARSSAAMAAVGSKLFVFGGLSRDCGWLNDMHAFDTGKYILNGRHLKLRVTLWNWIYRFKSENHYMPRGLLVGLKRIKSSVFY